MSKINAKNKVVSPWNLIEEVFKAFQSHIDSCIALEKEVFNELGVEGYNKAQGNCK